MKAYYLNCLCAIFVSLSYHTFASDIEYSLKDIQGGWWGNCEDSAVIFFIDGNKYSGDFLGSYLAEVKNNQLVLKNGLPEGHGIHVDGTQ